MINYAIQNNCGIEFEPGTYRITKTLLVDDIGVNFPTGFTMIGMVGPNRSTDTATGGVTISLDGNSTNQLAVLQFGHAAFRDITVERIGFNSRVSNSATPYGISFADTYFTHAKFDNVSVGWVNSAFSIASSGGANGEMVDINNCTGNYVRNFYKNTCGQAYLHHIINSNANILNGGTAFRVGNGNLGHSLDVFGFSSSFAPGPLVNTFFENDGVSGNINIIGGRQENIDTVLSFIGGSYNLQGMILMEGLQFTNLINKAPVIFGSVGLGNFTNSFIGCQFNAPNGSDVTLVDKEPGNSGAFNVFDKCIFQNITQFTGPVRFRDCRQCYPQNSPLVFIPNN
jgi:hypothetical protein